jgi:hypothetical protein
MAAVRATSARGSPWRCSAKVLSYGPLNDTMKAVLKSRQVDIRYDIEWTTLGEYLEFLEAQRRFSQRRLLRGRHHAADS